MVWTTQINTRSKTKHKLQIQACVCLCGPKHTKLVCICVVKDIHKLVCVCVVQDVPSLVCFGPHRSVCVQNIPSLRVFWTLCGPRHTKLGMSVWSKIHTKLVCVCVIQDTYQACV